MSEYPAGEDEPLDRRGLQLWHVLLAVTAMCGAVMVIMAFVYR